jgi:hypothetical protein
MGGNLDVTVKCEGGGWGAQYCNGLFLSHPMQPWQMSQDSCTTNMSSLTRSQLGHWIVQHPVYSQEFYTALPWNAKYLKILHVKTIYSPSTNKNHWICCTVSTIKSIEQSQQLNLLHSLWTIKMSLKQKKRETTGSLCDSKSNACSQKPLGRSPDPPGDGQSPVHLLPKEFTSTAWCQAQEPDPSP